MRTCEGSIGGRGVPVSTCELAQAASSAMTAQSIAVATGRTMAAIPGGPPQVSDASRERRATRKPGALALADARPVDRIGQPALDMPGKRAEARVHLEAAAGHAAAGHLHHPVEAGHALAVLVERAAHAQGLGVFDEPVAAPQRIDDLDLEHASVHVG